MSQSQSFPLPSFIFPFFSASHSALLKHYLTEYNTVPTKRRHHAAPVGSRFTLFLLRRAFPFLFCFAFSLSCRPTRHAVSARIKDRVVSSYSAEPARLGPDYRPISPADRSALKSNILSLLAGASPSRTITVQLCEHAQDSSRITSLRNGLNCLTSPRPSSLAINILEVGEYPWLTGAVLSIKTRLHPKLESLNVQYGRELSR